MRFISTRITICLLGAAVLAGCDDFPKDIAGTMNSVLESGRMRTGIVAGGTDADERAIAMQIASALNVSADYRTGSTEALVRQLNEGEIDIVVGEFAKATPWAERTALTAPARATDPPKDHPVLRALVRSGENRWLIFVSRTLKGSQT